MADYRRAGRPVEKGTRRVGAIRRAYVYAVALVSLVVGAASVDGALTWVARVMLEPADHGEVPLFAVAGVIVQLPIWIVHWGIAQRSVARHPDDRAATIRRLYLILAVAGAVGVTVGAVASIIRDAVGNRSSDTVGNLAAIITATPILLLHRWALIQDRAITETATGAAVRRAYLAFVAGVAAIVALGNADELVRVIFDNLFGIATERDVPQVTLVADSAGTLVAATIAWATHHRGAILAVPGRTPSDRADPERRAFLPALYRMVVVTVAVAFTLGNVTRMLDWAASFVVGPPGSPNVAVAASASLLTYTLAWWAFRHSFARDLGDASNGPTTWVTTLDRTHRYAVTVVALAVAATGVAQLVSMVLDSRIGASPDGVTSLRDVRFWVAATSTGLPTWVAYWRPSGHPGLDARETASKPRRGALYVVVFACAVSLLTAGVWVTYGLLGMALGQPFEFPMIAIGATVVASVVGAYHLAVLRSESRLIAAEAAVRRPAVEFDGPDGATPWAAIRATPGRTVVTWHTTVAEARAEADQGEARWRAVARLDEGVATPGADASPP